MAHSFIKFPLIIGGTLKLLLHTSFAQNVDSLDNYTATVEVTGTFQQENRVIHQQQLFPQRTIDDLLERTPGLQMIKRGNFAWEPSVRGLNPYQFNTTIDGMHIFNACTDHMDPATSYVELNNLKRIDLENNDQIFSGGSSIGGGLNLQLNKALFSKQKVFHLSLGNSFQTNNGGWNPNISTQFTNNKWAFNASGSLRTNRNYKDGNGTEILYSQYHKWNAAFNLAYKLAENQHLNLSFIKDNAWNVGYPSLTMDVSFAHANILGLEHEIKWQHVSVQSKIYFNEINHAMDDTHRPDSLVSMHMDMPGWSQTIGFYNNGKWHIPANGSRFYWSFSGYQNRLDASMTMYPTGQKEMFMYTLPKVQRRNLSLLTGYTLDLSQQWALTTSLRGEFNGSNLYATEGKSQSEGMFGSDLSNNQWLWNANISLNYQINKYANIVVEMGRNARTASLQEMYGIYLFNRLDNYDYLGNPSLHTETSWNPNLKFDWHNTHFHLNINAFAYLMNHYIAGIILDNYSPMTTGASGVKQYHNIGTAQIVGFEQMLTYDVNENLSISTINTFKYGKDQNNNALPLIAPFHNEEQVFWTSKIGKLYANLAFNAAQNHVSTQVYGEIPSKFYWLASGGYSKSFLIDRHQQITIGGSVQNIFNKNYFDHLDFRQIYRPGRNFILNVQYIW